MEGYINIYIKDLDLRIIASNIKLNVRQLQDVSFSEIVKDSESTYDALVGMKMSKELADVIKLILKSAPEGYGTMRRIEMTQNGSIIMYREDEYIDDSNWNYLLSFKSVNLFRDLERAENELMEYHNKQNNGRIIPFKEVTLENKLKMYDSIITFVKDNNLELCKSDNQNRESIQCFLSIV